MVECCLGRVETSPLVGGICNTPTYCDRGKAAKDDFNKGYGFGSVKVRLRTKSCRGVEFSTSGHAYTDTEKASGNLETKYKVCSYGLAFTQKWNIDDTLGTEIASQNKKELEGVPEGCPTCAALQVISTVILFYLFYFNFYLNFF
uniref:Non-selective voltage-gated ion channel VDAC3 n=1 Tax=Lynx canadensis TaxID=61383 RepID=A0A667FLP4_LYNCA